VTEVLLHIQSPLQASSTSTARPIMLYFNVAVVALIGQAAAAPNWGVSEAAYSSSRSSFVSSMLSSYSSAVAATATATTTGAISTTVLAPSIPNLPPGPDATSYPRDGKLHGAQPAPYTPSGGLGTNGSEPVYVPQTDFDFQSMVRGPVRQIPSIANVFTPARHWHSIKNT
jgi:hypothetical protein